MMGLLLTKGIMNKYIATITKTTRATLIIQVDGENDKEAMDEAIRVCNRTDMDAYAATGGGLEINVRRAQEPLERP
jgi:hypothetical protein